MKCRYTIFIVTIFYACGNAGLNTAQSSSQTGNQTYIISPVYPDTVFFMVSSVSKEKTVVTGNVAGFHNKNKENYELYFQRFAKKKNNFRIIHAVGNGIEITNETNGKSSRKYAFNDTISFDELGNFKDTVDPVSLIPLYPGKAVKKGEEWKPKIPVKTAMGKGVAGYVFVIDSIFSDEYASTLARVKVDVHAALQPNDSLKNATVNVTGGGWFVWDCTINQRRETHLNAVYVCRTPNGEVRQSVQVDDNLKYYNGKENF